MCGYSSPPAVFWCAMATSCGKESHVMATGEVVLQSDQQSCRYGRTYVGNVGNLSPEPPVVPL